MRVLLSSMLCCSILQYDACDGSFIKQFAFVPGQPRGIKFHLLPSAHNPPRQQKMLLVCSAYTDSILKYNALTGSPLGTYATGVDTPWDLVVGPSSTGVGRDPEDIFVSRPCPTRVRHAALSCGAVAVSTKMQ